MGFGGIYSICFADREQLVMLTTPKFVGLYLELGFGLTLLNCCATQWKRTHSLCRYKGLIIKSQKHSYTLMKSLQISNTVHSIGPQ